MSEDTTTKEAEDAESKPKEKTRILTVRLGQQEITMVDKLKASPYFVNMSEFIRESIRHYYENRVNKAGRPNKEESE